MRKIGLLLIVFIFFTGCSNKNKITLNNLSGGPIYFNFMAKPDSVDAGATAVIKDIPNGVYSYAATFGVPATATSVTISGDAAAGSLTFEKENTQILFIYSSTFINFTYNVGATMTSSNSSLTTSPTSP
jgi:hypothetical protein